MGKEAKDINRTTLEIALIDLIVLGHRFQTVASEGGMMLYTSIPQTRQMITLNPTSAKYSIVSVDFQNNTMELI
jgi:hypothetical protein